MHSIFLRIQTVVENSRSQRKTVHKRMTNLLDNGHDIDSELGGSRERTPLLSTRNDSVQSDNINYMQPGSPSVIGVPSTVLEPPNAYRSRWRSIKLLYATTFLSSMSFSINAGSLWPYLQQMDKSASAQLLGLIVAVYSLGQLVASLLVGVWANKRSHKEPIVFTLLLGLAGNAMYSYIEGIPAYRQYALMITRVILGVYAANIAAIRSYTSGATTMKERTTAFGFLSASQALGFIIGPGLQAVFAPVGYPGWYSSPYIYINMYTLPTLLTFLIILVNLVAMLSWFTEFNVSSEPYLRDRRADPQMKPDYLAVFSCLFMFFTILAVFCLGETILSPLGMDMYAWTREQATLYTGLMLLGTGAMSVVVFLTVKPISKYISEKKVLVIGHIFLLLGLFVYIPWGNDKPNIRIADLSPSSNSTLLSYNDTLVSVSSPSASVEYRGCNVLQQSWCLTTPKLYIEQFIGGQVFVAIGYPASFVVINTLYSKILPPSPQGIMMGMLTSAGCLARLIGPGVVGTLYRDYGPWPTYSAGMALIGLSLLVYLLSYKRIKPFSAPLRRHDYSQFDSAAPKT